MEVEISRELGSANPEKWMDGQKWAKQFKISSSTRHYPQTQPDTGTSLRTSLCTLLPPAGADEDQ